MVITPESETLSAVHAMWAYATAEGIWGMC